MKTSPCAAGRGQCSPKEVILTSNNTSEEEAHHPIVCWQMQPRRHALLTSTQQKPPYEQEPGSYLQDLSLLSHGSDLV
jgi:hypothetical protein